MRAFLSRTGTADHGGQCLDCNWFPSGHVGGIHDRQKHADREARAILAETESGDGTHHSAWYMSARTLTHGTMLSEGQAALAESLAAFIELEF